MIPARAPASCPRLCLAPLSSGFPAALGHFSGGFLIVMALTQALPVVGIDKQGPIPAMWTDMIHGRGTHPLALGGALPAEWLQQELLGTQIILPDRQTVPAVILCGRLARGFRPLVPLTVPAACQILTPRVAAWSKRFLRHGLSPPGKSKNAGANDQTRKGDHGLRRSTLRPLAISRMISVLQSLQYTGRPVASVSSSIRNSRWFRRQTGQVIQPSFVTSISRFTALCNSFPPLSSECA